MYAATWDKQFALSTDILRQLRLNLNRTAPKLSEMERALNEVHSLEQFQNKTWLLENGLKFGLSSDSADKYRAHLKGSVAFMESSVFTDGQYLKPYAISLGLSQMAHTLVERLNISTSDLGLPQISHEGVISSYSDGRVAYRGHCHKVDCYAGLVGVSGEKCTVETGFGLFLGQPLVGATHIFTLKR